MHSPGLLLFCEIKKERVLVEARCNVLSFDSDLGKVWKILGFLAIACLYSVTSRGQEPVFGQTWPLGVKPINCTCIALCRFSGRTRSEISLSSRLNKGLLAMRHTGKSSIKSKEAGFILFARYSSQLARSFYYTKKTFNALARVGSHSNLRCWIPFKSDVRTSRSQHIQGNITSI